MKILKKKRNSLIISSYIAALAVIVAATTFLTEAYIQSTVIQSNDATQTESAEVTATDTNAPVTVTQGQCINQLNVNGLGGLLLLRNMC
jgi:hypothetical protein